MTKILFLDIDGVLDSRRSAIALNGFPLPGRKEEKFDLVAVGLVRKICENDVKIVLSSTWRLWKNYQKILELPIIDRTPDLDGFRGEEIAQWIAENGDPDKYAILDDDSDMLAEQLPHFVHVDGNNGLLLKDYISVCKILDIPED